MVPNYDWLAPAMFLSALLFLLLGYPVAFSFGGVALLFTVIGELMGQLDNQIWAAMPQRIFGTMNNFTLLAVAYFIFLGSMLQKSGLAEDLLETMGRLFGRLRGGLAIAVVLVGALLAATTGVVAATVIAMGMIALPTMLRYGYDRRFASGVITASGTLGQLIPPSVVLVVLGDQLGVPVGDLFMGSLVPGLLMTMALILYVVIASALDPNLAPALPQDDLTNQNLGLDVIRVMLPPLVLILLILGSIFFGIATPTEAGAIGCVGAMVLAWINRRLDLSVIGEVCETTLRTTSMVMFILIGSQAFSMIFRRLHGDDFVVDLFAKIPGGDLGFLLASLGIIFGLGFFIDFFEIAFIVVPLCVPIAQKLGIDLLWFGVLIGTNLQTSFLTPPFGFALFYLRNVAPPEVTTRDIYQGSLPFIGVQLAVLALILIFPDLVTFLPNLDS